MKYFIATILLLVSINANAQALKGLDNLTPYLPTDKERLAADITSWVEIGTMLYQDTKTSCIDTVDKKHGCLMEALRVGVTIGGAELAKILVHRSRPCAVDNLGCGIDSPTSSFFSMHTALGFQAMPGLSDRTGWTLGVTIGVNRVLAGKHFASDVVTGALFGWATGKIR